MYILEQLDIASVPYVQGTTRWDKVGPWTRELAGGFQSRVLARITIPVGLAGVNGEAAGNITARGGTLYSECNTRRHAHLEMSPIVAQTSLPVYPGVSDRTT